MAKRKAKSPAVRGAKKAAKPAPKKPPGAKCLMAGCEQSAHCRGLCSRDYGAARLRVLAGLVSWEELEADGLALARSKRGRKISPAIGKLMEETRRKDKGERL